MIKIKILKLNLIILLFALILGANVLFSSKMSYAQSYSNETVFITNSQDFDLMRTNPSGTFELKSDIDFSLENKFSPIEFFCGSFNGNNYELKNLNLRERNNDIAFFIKLSNAKIKNIIFRDFQAYGESNVGILACKIENSYLENIAIYCKDSIVNVGNNIGLVASEIVNSSIIRLAVVGNYKGIFCDSIAPIMDNVSITSSFLISNRKSKTSLHHKVKYEDTYTKIEDKLFISLNGSLHETNNLDNFTSDNFARHEKLNNGLPFIKSLKPIINYDSPINILEKLPDINEVKNKNFEIIKNDVKTFIDIGFNEYKTVYEKCCLLDKRLIEVDNFKNIVLNINLTNLNLDYDFALIDKEFIKIETYKNNLEVETLREIETIFNVVNNYKMQQQKYNYFVNLKLDDMSFIELNENYINLKKFKDSVNFNDKVLIQKIESRIENIASQNIADLKINLSDYYVEQLTNLKRQYLEISLTSELELFNDLIFLKKKISDKISFLENESFNLTKNKEMIATLNSIFEVDNSVLKNIKNNFVEILNSNAYEDSDDIENYIINLNKAVNINDKFENIKILFTEAIKSNNIKLLKKCESHLSNLDATVWLEKDKNILKGYKLDLSNCILNLESKNESSHDEIIYNKQTIKQIEELLDFTKKFSFFIITTLIFGFLLFAFNEDKFKLTIAFDRFKEKP